MLSDIKVEGEEALRHLIVGDLEVGIIDDGLMAAEGTPRELKAQVGKPRLELNLAEGTHAARLTTAAWQRGSKAGRLWNG